MTRGRPVWEHVWGLDVVFDAGRYAPQFAAFDDMFGAMRWLIGRTACSS